MMTLGEFRALTKKMSDDLEMIVVDGEFGEGPVQNPEVRRMIIVESQNGTEVWIKPEKWGKDYLPGYFKIKEPEKDYLYVW